MTKFSPPKPTGKSPFPINLDEIASQPKKFVESAAQNLGFTSASTSPEPERETDLKAQKAAQKIADQQKISQLRSQLRTELDQGIAQAARLREENRPTSRLSQDQPQEPPQEQNAILNPPSAPKKHLFPGQIAAAKRKATQIETRARVAGT